MVGAGCRAGPAKVISPRLPPSRGVGSRAKAMSVVTTQRPGGSGSVVPDVPLPPLPAHWRSLPRAFVATARENWAKVGMADSLGTNLTYGKALISALAMGRALGRELGPEPYVGVMVPPSVGGAL